MRTKGVVNLLLVPALFAFFYGLRVLTDGSAIDEWLPKWHTLFIIATMIVLERLYAYRYAVSQRHVLGRDIVSTLVNVYVSAAVTGMLLLPVLAPAVEFAFGREKIFASAEELGPLWVQIPVILIAVSFIRYWIHRWQHSNAFLWKLHSYHHSVTDLKGSNTYVSHPLDWALRNALVFVVFGLIGFDPE